MEALTSREAAEVSARTEELFAQQRDSRCRQTDRVFAVLLVLQWIGGIITAIVVSPRTWIGDTSQVHIHVWAAIVLGGVLTSLPLFLVLVHPGRPLTRHVVAVAQMLWSALLIHLSGGRIETHFHVFGSLAFLAFYRDWKVLITATVVVALDHFIRGVWWPQSVFGVFVESPYRWIEHAAWVVFEDVFLIISCQSSINEERELCERQAELEVSNARMERRTIELGESNNRLTQEITERMRAERERTQLHSQLLETSRKVGMAEVATSVLHNVGNVLNSVNVSAHMVVNNMQGSPVEKLDRAVSLLEEHQEDLVSFLSAEDRGHSLPRYLRALEQQFSQQNLKNLDELAALIRNIEHIKAIVGVQQSFGRVSCASEPVHLDELLDTACKINEASLQRHGVTIVREYEDLPPVVVDKHKILQILVNLISNAKHALYDSDKPEKKLILRVTSPEPGTVDLQVIDDGVGIERDQLTKIFAHGYTTRKEGHGFGLHSSALAAKEHGGRLTVDSDGPGHGAVFTLTLPLKIDEESLCPV